MNSYTCGNCKQSFETNWSDQEAEAEYATNFPKLPPEEDRVVVCDDCYHKIMAHNNHPIIPEPDNDR